MKLSAFDFELPQNRIARFPSHDREKSKLMVINKKSGEMSHCLFQDIISMIGKDDFLVMNNSKVIPAKLFGTINQSVVQALIMKPINSREIEALTKPAKKFKVGTFIQFDKDLRAQVIERGERGRRILHFNKGYDEVLKIGYAPLPPYIKRKYQEANQYKAFDLDRYQTVYAKSPGSIAAPTAGLHFSNSLLQSIRKKTEIMELTLAVGEATFQTITADDISKHKMGKEAITIKQNVIKQIQVLKKSKQLIAVGTTSVRALETHDREYPHEEEFISELFIYPGFQFRLVDKMITNFHLPKSSLFILVAAFAGLELMKEAYRIAIEKDYHFFSYGDAMLII